MPMEHLPEKLAREVQQWEIRQRYHPEETEKVEGNLRMTKIRRTIPITAHYYSNFTGGENPNRK